MNENSEFKIAQNISASKSHSFERKAVAPLVKQWVILSILNGFIMDQGRCKFYTNRSEFQERRIYANGKVNMEKYSS
jgi:hypothetical protein